MQSLDWDRDSVLSYAYVIQKWQTPDTVITIVTLLTMICTYYVATALPGWHSGRFHQSIQKDVRDMGSIHELEDLLEKEMATHSSILSWKIPWLEEPGVLQSMWSQRVRHDWVTEHARMPVTTTVLRTEASNMILIWSWLSWSSQLVGEINLQGIILFITIKVLCTLCLGNSERKTKSKHWVKV